MSVRITEEAIWLEGRCLVEDSETLLVAIQRWPELPINIGGAQKLHLSVIQILLVIKPALRGSLRDPLLARYIFGKSVFD